MGKRLVLLLWFASILWSGCAMAQEKTAVPNYLTEEEAGTPQFVSTWLKEKGATADRKEADWYFELGVREKQKKNWSAATKAFGESMIRYPSPQALAEYAVAELRMMGEVRSRQKSIDSNKLSDLAHALGYYKSALSADSVLNTLPKDDNEQIRLNVECLDAYVQSGKVQGNCPALEAYGIIR